MFIREHEEKPSLESLGRRWEDIIKTDLKGIGRESVSWIIHFRIGTGGGEGGNGF
jgi:hypothetical protein